MIKDLLNSKLKTLINLGDLYIDNHKNENMNIYNKITGNYEELDLDWFLNHSLELNMENNEAIEMPADLPDNIEMENSYTNIINTISNSSLSNDLANKLYDFLFNFTFYTEKKFYKQIIDIPSLHQFLNYIKKDLEIFLKNNHNYFFNILSKN